MDRSRFTRWAAPVAFLAAITIGALVVRAGFEHGKHHANDADHDGDVEDKKTHEHAHKRRALRTYTVQSGDTFESIATKTGTTVARLKQLNPGIDPTALHVGQKIRVQ